MIFSPNSGHFHYEPETTTKACPAYAVPSKVTRISNMTLKHFDKTINVGAYNLDQ